MNWLPYQWPLPNADTLEDRQEFVVRYGDGQYTMVYWDKDLADWRFSYEVGHYLGGKQPTHYMQLTTPQTPQAPIAKLTIADSGLAGVEMLAPGLPPGEHLLYCEPEAVAPYLRDQP